MTKQETAAVQAAQSLQNARDSLLAVLWAENQGAKDFHQTHAIKSIQAAAAFLCVEIIEASKSEAA